MFTQNHKPEQQQKQQIDMYDKILFSQSQCPITNKGNVEKN